jgi:hypothetical protein
MPAGWAILERVHALTKGVALKAPNGKTWTGEEVKWDELRGIFEVRDGDYIWLVWPDGTIARVCA